jgi:hypothetical protein
MLGQRRNTGYGVVISTYMAFRAPTGGELVEIEVRVDTLSARMTGKGTAAVPDDHPSMRH